MKRIAWILLLTGSVAAAISLAPSNIDPVNKYSWSENKGWMNWRDANGAADGVEVLADHLAGYVWWENDGWMNVGPGGGPYANDLGDSSTFGVNILGNGDLDGYAWSENSGWVNFGWAASTANTDRARFDSGAGRFRGYAWGENSGWINLDDATHYVGASVSGCTHCQLHADVFPFTLGDANNNPVGNCVVDIDDILTILSSFSAASQCGPDFPDTVNMFPCGQACPDGVVDIDDILSTLAAFSGTYGCPHPCPGGACCFGDSSCQDWDGIGAGTTPIGGMSITTCGDAGGVFQGDDTTCDTVICP